MDRSKYKHLKNVDEFFDNQENRKASGAPRWQTLEELELAEPEEPEYPPELQTDDESLVETYKSEAYTCCQRKMYEVAIDFYTEAIGLKENHAPLYKRRGACFWLLHRYRDARDDARKALLLDSNYEKGMRRVLVCSILIQDIEACDAMVSHIDTLPAHIQSSIDISEELNWLKLLKDNQKPQSDSK